MGDLTIDSDAFLLYRQHELPQILKLSPRTISELIRRGELPHVVLGTGRRRLRLFPRFLLELWLRSKANFVPSTDANDDTTVSEEGRQ